MDILHKIERDVYMKAVLCLLAPDGQAAPSPLASHRLLY